MKKFIKNNMLAILIVGIFGVILVNGDYTSLQEYKKYAKDKQRTIQECEEIIKISTDKMEIDECKENIKKATPEYDFYTLLTDVLVWRVQFIYYLAFLFVAIPTIPSICKTLKNKYIINSNTRESYSSFLKKLFKNAYRYIWILPLLAFILMIPLLMNTSLNPEYSILNGTSGWSNGIIHHPALFVSTYLLYMVLCSIIFVNIVLIVAHKQHKIIPCIIFSYITYYAVEIFLELVISGLLFTKILKTDLGLLFNIMNIFSFHDGHGIPLLLLVTVLFVMISFGFVYLIYRNKENLVIQCEKNK